MFPKRWLPQNYQSIHLHIITYSDKILKIAFNKVFLPYTTYQFDVTFVNKSCHQSAQIKLGVSKLYSVSYNFSPDQAVTVRINILRSEHHQLFQIYHPRQPLKQFSLTNNVYTFFIHLKNFIGSMRVFNQFESLPKLKHLAFYNLNSCSRRQLPPGLNYLWPPAKRKKICANFCCHLIVLLLLCTLQGIFYIL